MTRRNKKPGPLAKVKDRPGEFTVPIFKQVVPQPDGSTLVSVGLKFDDIPIPERRYVADVGAALFNGTVVQLLFGQKLIVGDGLRSLVAVSVSPEGMRRFLDTCEAFLPRLGQFIEKGQLVKPDLITLDKEPDQTVAVAANIITAAHAAREASIDFYHTSAASLHALNQRDRLAIDPILRVDLPTGLLASIMDKLVELKEELPLEIT